MYTHWRRPELSQRFLHNRQLIQKLLRQSSVSPNDLVVEIGPGRGIITQELLRLASEVIAIELDEQLFNHLKKKFTTATKLTLIHQDFLTWTLPQKPYKVFANLPFDVEGLMVRKLVDADNPPQDCYVVVRKDVAERWAGISYRGQFSVKYRPWFNFTLIHKFRRQDFMPKPKVAAVMLRINRRTSPMLPRAERNNYQRFIEVEFQSRRRPTALTLKQWLQLYRERNSFKFYCIGTLELGQPGKQ
jgi:23S rRNA (adenine-N6)-dimethyltransferase